MSKRLNPCVKCGPDSTGKSRFSRKRGMTRHDDRVCSQCRKGIPTEVAASPQKYGRQIRYAERRGIPFVWFPATEQGSPDQVKDIRSGDQVDADPAAWMPPDDDLGPAIVVSTSSTDDKKDSW